MINRDKVWLADPNEVFIPAEVLDQNDREMANELVDKYTVMGSVVLVAILNGAKTFADNLTEEAFKFSDYPDIDRDAIHASSYLGKDSTGLLSVHRNLQRDIEGRHVVLVEDILDTGFTLKLLVERLLNERPASLTAYVMLNKQDVRPADFDLGIPVVSGLKIADRFVVGRGLDFDQQHRELPYVTACYTDEGRLGQPIHLSEDVSVGT